MQYNYFQNQVFDIDRFTCTMSDFIKNEPNSPHHHQISSRSSSAQNSEIERDSSDSEENTKSSNSISYKERRREAHTQVFKLIFSFKKFKSQKIR